MKLKSWQGVPAIGEKSYYRDRIEWRNLERRLPEPFRFSGNSEPQECFKKYRGWEVHLDIWENLSSEKTLILCHGGGGNGRLVSFLAPAMLDVGYRVICPDLPGYGLTVRQRRKKISYNLWADIIADIAREEFRNGSGRLQFMGLSLGGLLAYGAAMRCGSEIAGGIIATTLLDTRRPDLFARAARLPALGYISYAMRGLLGLLAGRLRLPMRLIAPMEKITNDPLLSGLIASDPISGDTRTQLCFLLSLISYDIAVEPENAEIPLLVAHPGLDPWTGPELSRPFFERYGGPRHWVDLPGCGHFPIEEPGFSSLVDAIRDFSAQ